MEPKECVSRLPHSLSSMFCSITPENLLFPHSGSLHPTRPEPRLAPLGHKLFRKTTPQTQVKTVRELCGLIFPCVQLHACLGGDAGVVTGLQRWAGRCLSVVGFVDGLQSESPDGRYPLETLVRGLLVPRPPPQSFLCLAFFSLPLFSRLPVLTPRTKRLRFSIFGM